MAKHIEPPPVDFKQPPGTVLLIKDQLEEPQLVYQPRPSEDPEDPLNWSTTRKMMNFVPTLAITAVIFTQASIPLVFWVLWESEFGWTFGQLTIAMAINYIGTAVGCFFFIPPAVKYGRRSVYIVSTAFIVATCVWSARMNSLSELYITQLISGLASSTNETIVQMTVADLFFVHQRGTANGVYMVMVMIGSFLSSVAAGYMAAGGNWRLCFWVTSAFGFAIWIYFCVLFEESKYIPRSEGRMVTPYRAEDEGTSIASTGKPAVSTIKQAPTAAGSHSFDIEMSRAATRIQSAQAGRPPINTAIRPLSYRERMRLTTTTDHSLAGILWEAAIVLVRFPAVSYTALTYAFCLCWISAQASLVSIVFTQPPYNFGTVGVGNMSLGVFVGCILGSVYGAATDKTVAWFARRNYGYYEPEMRLHLSHLPAVCMGGGFIMFGVTAAKGMHWAYPSVGSGLFGFGLGGLSDVALCVLIDSYEGVTGEAFIGVTLIRNCFSIAIAFALVPWMEYQGLQNMTIIMGLWATVMAFTHLPLIWWGKKIRQKTAPRYEAMVAVRGNGRL